MEVQRQAMTRTAVRAVECPACGAGPQERCRGARGRPREANHLERVQVAQCAASEAEAADDPYTRNDDPYVRND